ncbi:phenylacetate--CoA ligase family protein [Bradyrhizobium sp. 930_D9_N1_4]|uniref:phenylacetate--CoA ligase family protein n=1 Tax=Bradyrhizobium sp. 930_D9_N1_4 TaxID=3240374 RepID=UPI003F8AD93F
MTRAMIAPRTRSKMVLAENLDALSVDEIDNLANRNFKNLIASIRCVDRLMETYPALRDVDTVEGLRHLTPFSSANLSRAPASDSYLFNPDDPGIALGSSGTSGAEKFMYHSWDYNDQVKFIGARGLKAALANSLPKKLANCASFGDLLGSGMFVHDLGQFIPVLTFPIGIRAPIERVLELIRRHQIDTVVSTPKVLTAIVAQAPADTSCFLRNALYHSGGIQELDADFLEERGLFVRATSYTATETGPIGYQCASCDHSTYHINQDAYHVEIVSPPTWDAVAAGQSGELLITPFSDTGMAVLRCRIGDRATALTEPCACGSHTQRIRLEGRTAWSILIDSFNMSEEILLDVLRPAGISSPAQFQLSITWTGLQFTALLKVDQQHVIGHSDSDLRSLILARHHLRNVFASARCETFDVRACAVEQFFTTRSGKTPSLHQTHPKRHPTED